jgi:hypothetical protein
MAGCAVAQARGPGVDDELVSSARAHGVVQVIVLLRVPAGAPAPAVEAVKRVVLDSIAATRHRVVHALPNLPQVVIEASEDTLRVLGASPDVLRVQAPGIDRPMR